MVQRLVEAHVWVRPTTVSTIMNYISRSADNTAIAFVPLRKSDFLTLMEAIWQHVTPSFRGIPSTKALKKGALRYIAANSMHLNIEELDIPKNRRHRPEPARLLGFLRESLENDAPVAFLSLDNGTEELLDTWHWVTLLSLEYEEDGSIAYAEIADAGKLLRVDIKKWFDTTKLGGGFVRFTKK